MAERVPVTLFTNVTSVSTYAEWIDPLNLSNPWNGYPYQWTVTVSIQPQVHSDPYTQTPFSYNGLDVTVGQWLIFPGQTMAVQIISISSQTDTTLTMIVEDVGLTNILNNPGQSGQGIGPVSPPGQFNCLIVTLNAEGLPVFASISDYEIPVNLISSITNRFMNWNYVQDFIPVTQIGHTFAVGDVIWLDSSGIYHASLASDAGAEVTVGTVTSINQPSIGDFSYRPSGRYVENLPTLPGNTGQILYVSATTPGGVTDIAPSPVAIPVYIKITNTSAILTNGTGGGGGSSGNLSISGNSIFATNPNGNINLIPNGNGTVNISSANIPNLTVINTTISSLTQGRIVLVGTNGQIIDNALFVYDINSQSISIGNIQVSSQNITTTTSGVPLVLNANNANVTVTTALDLSGFRINNVQDPIEPQDAATKHYVDIVAQGLSPKAAVYLATLTDLNATFNPLIAYGTLTSNVDGVLGIDGYTPSVGARILVKNQLDPVENGIYQVDDVGSISLPWSMSRTSDFNGQGTAGIVATGDFVFVEAGDYNASTGWVQVTQNPVVVNTDPIVWVQFSYAGVIQPGFGLTKDGVVLNVNVSPIINSANGLIANLGPLGFDRIEVNLDPNTPLEFNNGQIRISNIIAGTGLYYDLSGGNLSVIDIQPQITGLGNITSGTWSANIIATAYGGTGLGNIGLPAQVLTVNDYGTGLEYAYRQKFSEGNVAPYFPSPADGDQWFNSDTGICFTYITDETGSHWVEL